MIRIVIAKFPFEIKKGKEIIDRFETREQAEKAFKIFQGRGSAYKGIKLRGVK